ncbi:hypothetical protein WCE41_07005 [Luteimonas sp. MJ246]|uniref:hypothetical protein n=1 Tax=Luteimonas sp. MJ174 TaxID=3129237 RepID=UPI0031BB7491
MNKVFKSVTGASVLLLAACASTGNDRGADAPRGVETRSMDGSFTGEVIGQAAPDSGFAKLRIGMSPQEVQEIMDRVPDRHHSYESGKRWIPFYYGNDARRMQALYRGEGCLIFTDGNIWGGAGGDLVQIEVDPSGACYQP